MSWNISTTTHTYQSVLCCNSSGNPIGNLSTGTIFLYASGTTNAHVQDPSRTGLTTLYPYPVYISTSGSPQPTCVLQASCPALSTCLVSLSSRTNAHIANCSSSYTNKICCTTTGTLNASHTWSTIPATTIYLNMPANTSPQLYIADLGAYISGNTTSPIFSASSLSDDLLCSVIGNALYLQSPSATGGTTSCVVNSTQLAFSSASTSFLFTFSQPVTGGGSPGGGGAPPPLTTINTTVSNLTLQNATLPPTGQTGNFAQFVIYALLVVVGVYLLNLFLIARKKKERKEEQKKE